MRKSNRIKRQILQRLSGGKTRVYELIYYQDSSLPEVFEILQEMKRNYLIKIERGIVELTDKGRSEVDNLRIKHFGDILCSKCEGTGIDISREFSKVLSEYKKICKNRPDAIGDFDQGFMSEEGVARRVEFMYERGDLTNTEIFIVGDDDLLSIFAGLTELPKRIVVIDIDKRVVNFINRIAKERNLNIEAFVYDVQQEFPDSMKRSFDVFVTDPVETLPGIKLFLSRGVSTLKGMGCSGYFGLTTLEASRKKWYRIEQMVLRMGFVITDIKRHFNVYPEDEKNFFRYQDKLPIVKKLGFKINYNWYNSSLVRMEAIKEPKPLVEGKMVIDEKVYRDKESWATSY